MPSNSIKRSDAKPIGKVLTIGGKKTFRFYVPEDVLPCKDETELHDLLARYSRPFIQKHLPDNPIARRRYFEKTRPALRWWCKKFDTKIPEWLEGDGIADDMSEEELADFVGPEELDVQEFVPAEAKSQPKIASKPPSKEA